MEDKNDINDNKIYKKERVEYNAFIDAMNTKFNFY